MTKPEKSLLIKELETHLDNKDYNYGRVRNASYIIGVMATIRKLNFSRLSKFNEVLADFVEASYTSRQFGRCDYVFDMYSEEPSVKDSERRKRIHIVPVEYNSLDLSSQQPKDMRTFWPSSNNKLLLEKLIYKHLRSTTHSPGECPIVLGQVTKEEEGWQRISLYKEEENKLTHK